MGSRKESQVQAHSEALGLRLTGEEMKRLAAGGCRSEGKVYKSCGDSDRGDVNAIESFDNKTVPGRYPRS